MPPLTNWAFLFFFFFCCQGIIFFYTVTFSYSGPELLHELLGFPFTSLLCTFIFLDYDDCSICIGVSFFFPFLPFFYKPLKRHNLVYQTSLRPQNYHT